MTTEVPETEKISQNTENVTKISAIQRYANDFSESWYSGANDVVVVIQSDGSLKSTQLQVRVGKLTNFWTTFKSREGKKGQLLVNGEPVLCNEVEFILGGSGELLMHREGSVPSCEFTDHDLQQMTLKDGLNEAKLVFNDLGHEQPFDFYFYNQNIKIMITDIDGTITKSDFNGCLAKLFRWSCHHEGVIELFDTSARNGYIVVYLSAITQSADEVTRDYLFKQLQNQDGYSLPRSPLFMSPITWHTALLSADKAANKLYAIRSLLDIFDAKESVVVAAYGNKDTDTKAYIDSGINSNKIFCVNERSEMINVGTNQDTSYLDHFQKANEMYPKY